jgi:predicted regulator of Ras-like GTPase activity (Roadblock/LC7/MglB family)
MLLDIVETDPAQEEVWLWLAGLSEDLDEARSYLETVLALNPEHKRAASGLKLIDERIAARQRTGELKPVRPASPQMPEAPEESGRICEKCGNPIPEDSPFCPNCAHLGGRSAVEEVAELNPVAVEPAAHDETIDVNAEISPSFTLSIEQAEAIDTCLERMAYESEASCIILADITGQLISERGKTEGINTQVLSALGAGELSATQEMARLVGERARFNLLLHEGEERSVYLSPVGKKMLLIVVFDGRTPIGLVRIILKNAVDELGPILERPAAEAGGTLGETLNEDFAQQLEDQIDASMDLFAD